MYFNLVPYFVPYMCWWRPELVAKVLDFNKKHLMFESRIYIALQMYSTCILSITPIQDKKQQIILIFYIVSLHTCIWQHSNQVTSIAYMYLWPPSCRLLVSWDQQMPSCFEQWQNDPGQCVRIQSESWCAQKEVRADVAWTAWTLEWKNTVVQRVIHTMQGISQLLKLHMYIKIPHTTPNHTTNCYYSGFRLMWTPLNVGSRLMWTFHQERNRLYMYMH